MKSYTHRDQILKDIASAHKKIEKAKVLCQDHLDSEKLLEGTDSVVEMRTHREAADKLLRKIKRLQEVRLKKLGEKLAEMDTAPLPILTEVEL